IGRLTSSTRHTSFFHGHPPGAGGPRIINKGSRSLIMTTPVLGVGRSFLVLWMLARSWVNHSSLDR
ncbi:MAG: hypothetical protein WCO89_11690, partial [Syntrophus sp. (in: bacteria)]